MLSKIILDISKRQFFFMHGPPNMFVRQQTIVNVINAV